MKQNIAILFLGIVLLAVTGVFVVVRDAPLGQKFRVPGGHSGVSSFEECMDAGNPVMESYPRQCRSAEGQLFIEYIGNELEKQDFIRLVSPRPNQIIESPLIISGQARGPWFFEADFPVILSDQDGRSIAHGIATAQGEWMTRDFVPFEAVLIFSKPTHDETGLLVLHKDNPSGLPEHDDALEVPIRFR